MADGDSALVAFIARMRKLGTLGADAAKLAAPLVERAVKATAAAGTAPDGMPWKPKKDGSRALPNAAAALTVKALGPVVVVTLKGIEVVHNFAKDGRLPRRQILPDGGAGIPKNVAAALEQGAKQAFDNAMGGA